MKVFEPLYDHLSPRYRLILGVGAVLNFAWLAWAACLVLTSARYHMWQLTSLLNAYACVVCVCQLTRHKDAG